MFMNVMAGGTCSNQYVLKSSYELRVETLCSKAFTTSLQQKIWTGILESTTTNITTKTLPTSLSNEAVNFRVSVQKLLTCVFVYCLFNNTSSSAKNIPPSDKIYE